MALKQLPEQRFELDVSVRDTAAAVTQRLEVQNGLPHDSHQLLCNGFALPASRCEGVPATSLLPSICILTLKLVPGRFRSLLALFAEAEGSGCPAMGFSRFEACICQLIQGLSTSSSPDAPCQLCKLLLACAIQFAFVATGSFMLIDTNDFSKTAVPFPSCPHGFFCTTTEYNVCRDLQKPPSHLSRHSKRLQTGQISPGTSIH